jgi:hypothetical protein
MGIRGCDRRTPLMCLSKKVLGEKSSGTARSMGDVETASSARLFYSWTMDGLTRLRFLTGTQLTAACITVAKFLFKTSTAQESA